MDTLAQLRECLNWAGEEAMKQLMEILVINDDPLVNREYDDLPQLEVYKGSKGLRVFADQIAFSADAWQPGRNRICTKSGNVRQLGLDILQVLVAVWLLIDRNQRSLCKSWNFPSH